MDIKVEEKDGLYCVCVKIEPYNPRVKRKTIVTTSSLRSAASKLGYEFGEIVQEDRIKNMNGTTEGTWVFKKKVLDKPVKDVILKEEKPVLPKTSPKPKAKATRKKRTRSSTKKVSTEE